MPNDCPSIIFIELYLDTIEFLVWQIANTICFYLCNICSNTLRMNEWEGICIFKIIVIVFQIDFDFFVLSPNNIFCYIALAVITIKLYNIHCGCEKYLYLDDVKHLFS